MKEHVTVFEERLVDSFTVEWGEQSGELVWNMYLPPEMKGNLEFSVMSALEEALTGKYFVYVEGPFGCEMVPMHLVTSIRPLFEEEKVKPAFDEDFDEYAFETEDPPEDEPPPMRHRYVAGDRVVLTRGAYAGTKATVTGVYGTNFDPSVSLCLDLPGGKAWNAPEAHVARLADDK